MTRPPKQRADLLLVALGLAESRARAQALILAGLVVFINLGVDLLYAIVNPRIRSQR